MVTGVIQLPEDFVFGGGVGEWGWGCGALSVIVYCFIGNRLLYEIEVSRDQ